MKKILITASIAALGFAFAGCEKSKDYKAPFVRTGADDALLKIIYASAYAANPSVQISIDDVRVSGLITGRTPFPGGGYNTSGSNFPDYLVVKPGSRKLTIAIPKKGTNVDSVVFYTTQIDVKAKANHTLNVMDTLTKTKSVMVEDTVALPAPGTVKYRFVNLMPNAPKLDLYYGTIRVATGIDYNTAGVVFVMPYQTASTWAIRETGTSPTSTALATYPSGSSMTDQRMFTAFAMGYKGSSSTNLKPYISFSINR